MSHQSADNKVERDPQPAPAFDQGEQRCSDISDGQFRRDLGQHDVEGKAGQVPQVTEDLDSIIQGKLNDLLHSLDNMAPPTQEEVERADHDVEQCLKRLSKRETN